MNQNQSSSWRWQGRHEGCALPTANLTACSWCSSVYDELNGTWDSSPELFAQFESHGICPKCKDEMAKEIAAQKRADERIEAAERATWREYVEPESEEGK